MLVGRKAQACQGGSGPEEMQQVLYDEDATVVPVGLLWDICENRLQGCGPLHLRCLEVLGPNRHRGIRIPLAPLPPQVAAEESHSATFWRRLHGRIQAYDSGRLSGRWPGFALCSRCLFECASRVADDSEPPMNVLLIDGHDDKPLPQQSLRQGPCPPSNIVPSLLAIGHTAGCKLLEKESAGDKEVVPQLCRCHDIHDEAHEKIDEGIVQATLLTQQVNLTSGQLDAVQSQREKT
mmetsp:Transcript_106961/g.268983  ORF Transcript_106961/g.268983 Transcript_106961/m.268983 type:complete len:236 (-) Transcript_106961:726-1433(-)